MMKKVLLTAVAVLFVLSLSAGAALIDIPNAGFEDRETFDPFPESTDKYLQWAKESWRHFEVDNNGGPVRIWNPGVVGVDETPQGIADVAFGGNAPEGKYVAVVRSRYNDNEMEAIRPIRDWEAVAQILEATFDPTLTYELSVDVGRLPYCECEGGSVNYTADWHGYIIQLAVGGTNVGGSTYQRRVEGGTVIAQVAGGSEIAANTFSTVTLQYNPDPANDYLEGQPLQIRLGALECNQYNHAMTGWAAFDNVQLTPEPMTIALLGLGGLGLIRRKR
jgi:hypothetical protein